MHEKLFQLFGMVEATILMLGLLVLLVIGIYKIVKREVERL
jgi:hypothetical protein